MTLWLLAFRWRFVEVFLFWIKSCADYRNKSRFSKRKVEFYTGFSLSQSTDSPQYSLWSRIHLYSKAWESRKWQYSIWISLEKECQNIVRILWKKAEKNWKNSFCPISPQENISVFLLTNMKIGLDLQCIVNYSNQLTQLHDPVLYEEVREIYLSQKQKHIVVDATLGLGGHAFMLANELQEGDIFLGMDRDEENLLLAKEYLQWVHFPSIVHPLHSSFSFLSDMLKEQKITEIDFILYDLGVSSVHYDRADRGFSFRFDGPLDMRFDRSWGLTVTELLMKTDARELARIFTLYGEEKKSWFIAQAIEKQRKIEPIDTTFKLLEIIDNASFDPKSPTRVFQSLRIALNEEFEHIETSLKQALDHLAIGGKILVITFHSLEDRLVKNIFAPYLADTIDEITGQIQVRARFSKYTKKPIIPTEAEIQRNPRSRSAKMRVIERIA